MGPTRSMRKLRYMVMISLALSSTFFSGSVLSPSLCMHMPTTTATTTTARMLLFVENDAKMLFVTEFGMMARGLNASMVFACPSPSPLSTTLKKPADCAKYATTQAMNAPQT